MLNLQMCCKKRAQSFEAEQCYSSFVSFIGSAVSQVLILHGELYFSVRTRTKRVFHKAFRPVSGSVFGHEINGAMLRGDREHLLLFGTKQKSGARLERHTLFQKPLQESNVSLTS